MKNPLAILIALAFTGAASADIQLKIKNSMDSTSTVTSNGQMARIDDDKMPGRVIVDYSGAQIFLVDSRRGEVLRVNLQGEQMAPEGIGVSLKDKGGGQKIAGYLTRKYELHAGGQKCGVVYTSQELMANNAIRGMFEAMRSMQNMTSGMMGGMGNLSSLLTDCQRANMQLADVVESAGAPLKVIDEYGSTVSEVISVNTEMQVPGGFYDVPAGMQVVDMTEKMNSAMQQGQEMMQQMPNVDEVMKNMPDMDELMQQIQQGGGEMSDEMQQQLQKLMQQLQQQQQ